MSSCTFAYCSLRTNAIILGVFGVISILCAAGIYFGSPEFSHKTLTVCILILLAISFFLGAGILYYIFSTSTPNSTD